MFIGLRVNVSPSSIGGHQEYCVSFRVRCKGEDREEAEEAEEAEEECKEIHPTAYNDAENQGNSYQRRC